jgi:hypothetical protein
MPLRPIPGRKGEIDAKWIAGDGDGPFNNGSEVEHSDTLDRLGRT